MPNKPCITKPGVWCQEVDCESCAIWHDRKHITKPTKEPEYRDWGWSPEMN